MWFSLHGYIHDYAALDQYMKKEFQTVIQPDMEKYFFIRYWLGGPHVRLRFKCKEEDYTKIKQRFQQSITLFLKENVVNLIDYNHFYDKTMMEKEGISEVYWGTHGFVSEMDYKPEYERYGGKHLIEKSESVFCESSVLANRLNHLERSKRMIVSLDLMYYSFQLGGFDPSAYSNYASLWVEYKRDGIYFSGESYFKKRLEQLVNSRMNIANVYQPYFSSLQQNEIINEYELLISHVHMTNNRIGVTPDIEYAIAQLIFKFLEGNQKNV
ncbi:lantibiotic dehydratase C-terminal domain-containing protein [Alkalihalobacillus sp. NPDC078783]